MRNGSGFHQVQGFADEFFVTRIAGEDGQAGVTQFYDFYSLEVSYHGVRAEHDDISYLYLSQCIYACRSLACLACSQDEPKGGFA